MSDTCKCPDPELCTKLKMHVVGRLWDIWNGTVLTPEKCKAYRGNWIKTAGLTADDFAPTKEVTPGASPFRPTEKRKPCNCRKK